MSSSARLWPAAVFFLALAASAAEPLPLLEIYKSATCSCCGAWEAHMKKAGFRVQTHTVADVSASREKLGMPERYASCHTARVGGYLLEGHVPAEDVKRLLAERPKALGLAVPGMPLGAPGMESAQPQDYESLLITANGHRVFARHPAR